ncbi:hypothetical protein BCV70DRAFT_162169 [Testicularia cyperi]|uniref:Uncharacterized protein n=1 Tax=Testicularia cyperi TaxID=1882483 RepID=A0A317XNH1_9BASI|nr:hypothetical protein BCV70DRAFT_162169 [Testicularia cyperi]
MADVSINAAGSIAGTPAASKKSRGANPSVDYKTLFQKSKDKFDRVSNDHTEIVTNIQRATAKQLKLREEIDFLLDAVASKRARRAQLVEEERIAQIQRQEEEEYHARVRARTARAGLPLRDADDRYGYASAGSSSRHYGLAPPPPPSAREDPPYRPFGSGMLQQRYSPDTVPPTHRELSSRRYDSDESSPAPGTLSRPPQASVATSSRAHLDAPPPLPPAASHHHRSSHHPEAYPSPQYDDAPARYRASPPRAPSSGTSAADVRSPPSHRHASLSRTDPLHPSSKRARPYSPDADADLAYPRDPREYHSKRPRND